MATRDLRTTIADAVLETIQGYDSSTDKLMFNNYGTLATMTRTTDNWMHALVGSTGIPALNNRTLTGYQDGAIINGILITPRHLVTSRHAAGQVNNVFYFWDRSNNYYSRTVIGEAGPSYTNAYGDFVVLTLDSDLPTAIEPLKVFPPDLYKYLDPSSITGATNTYTPSEETYIVSTDQEEKSLVHKLSYMTFGDEMTQDGSPNTITQPTYTSDARIGYSAPSDSEAAGWREGLVAGDSGSPHFAIVDDELIFLGVTVTTSYFDGFINFRMQNDINLLIAEADADATTRGTATNTGYTLTTYDMTGFTQYSADNGIDYTFIGDDISAGVNIQFRGGAIDHNGYHYSIPYAGSSIVRTDPRDGSQTLYSVGSLSMSTQKWVDAVYAPNKRIYAANHAANGPLVINTEDPDNVTIDMIGSLTYGYQVRSIALKTNPDNSGVGYMLPYSGSQTLRRFTFQSDGREQLTTGVNYTYPIASDPYFQYRDSQSGGSAFDTLADQDLGNASFIYHSYGGIVNGNNGKLYGIPYGGSFVMVIDTNNSDAISFLTDTALSGNAGFSNIGYFDDYLYLRSPQWSKYRGGVLASNGCIYAHGTHARAILKIDTSDDTVTEIPYPHTIIQAMTAGQIDDYSDTVGYNSASFFSVLGPDGKVYNTAWNIDYQLSIDPTDDSIEFESLSAIINEDTTGFHTGWYTAADLNNNTVYNAPGIANNVLQMNFDGYSPAPYSTVTPFSSPASSSSPSASPTPTGTPTGTPTPTKNYSPPVTLSNTATPTNTPTQTPTISITPSNSKPAPTPSNSPTVSNSSSATPTPSVTPTSKFEKCVKLEYDVEDGPDRFIVTYRDVVIIDTGFIGNVAYKYGNSKRQIFIDALIAEGTDFTGVDLALDGYPVVDSTTEGEIEAVVDRMNETEAFVTIQSPVHNKPGWRYTLNCPMDCVSPTPTQTQTPTQTGTPTPTPSATENYIPPASLSNTPTGTPTSTPTPSSTPTTVPSYSLTQTPTQTGTPTQTPTRTPQSTPTATATASITPTQTQTPTVTDTPLPSASVTPSNSSTPPSTPTLTATPTNTPSNSSTPPSTPTLTATPTGTPQSTPTLTATGTPTNTPTQTGTPQSTPTLTATPTNTPTGTPPGTPPSTPPSTPSQTPSSSSIYVFPSLTSTPSETPTSTPPGTPSGTPTNTPTNTPTQTGTPQSTPTLTATPTGTPPSTPPSTPTSTPPGTPSHTPSGTPPSTPTSSFISPPDPT